LLSSSTSWRQQDKATTSSLATLIASNPNGNSPTAPATQSASSAPVTASPSSSTQIQTFPRASHDEQARKIVIEWNDGEVSRFHITWLFDHCRCDSCFHPMTKQRRKGLLEVSLSLVLVLEFSEGHPFICSCNRPKRLSLIYRSRRTFNPPRSNLPQLAFP
jgi:hypothetical protein